MSHLHPSESPYLMITPDGSLHGDDTAENREMARRIQACINACAGLTTEELERGIVDDMRRVIAQVAPLLQDKRDQLEEFIQSRTDGE